LPAHQCAGLGRPQPAFVQILVDARANQFGFSHTQTSCLRKHRSAAYRQQRTQKSAVGFPKSVAASLKADELFSTESRADFRNLKPDFFENGRAVLVSEVDNTASDASRPHPAPIRVFFG
jgi:hypothetical protein